MTPHLLIHSMVDKINLWHFCHRSYFLLNDNHLVPMLHLICCTWSVALDQICHISSHWHDTVICMSVEQIRTNQLGYWYRCLRSKRFSMGGRQLVLFLSKESEMSQYNWIKMNWYVMRVEVKFPKTFGINQSIMIEGA